MDTGTILADDKSFVFQFREWELPMYIHAKIGWQLNRGLFGCPDKSLRMTKYYNS